MYLVKGFMKEKLKRVVWYKSIAFNIIVWFLPIIIIPILIISYDSNTTIIENIRESYYHDIKQVSSLESKFINNWFKYREIDIETWSKAESSEELLTRLSDEFKKSNKNLYDFIKSDEYKNTNILMGNDFYNLLKRYDYVYDLFLIDVDGNVLFSVEEENDLGTNLLTGIYAKTKFAATVKQTLQDGKIHFSDLEFYRPSGNAVAGFFTAPIVNDSGKIIGIFATQIKLNVIYELFNRNFGTLFSHYLVGSEGTLRSKISTKDEILKLEVSDRQLEILNENDDTINNYLNPLNSRVFGIHQQINILGVKWTLVSEAETEYINEVASQIISKAFTYIFITLLIVLFVSFMISKKIVKPILTLSKLMLKFSEGKRNIVIEVDSQDEIGILSRTFKDTIIAIKKGEKEIEEEKGRADKALQEVLEQKYALDSHSIVAITDVKGNITFVNDKFVEISGYKREELIGQNHRLLNSNIHSQKYKQYWANMYHDISSGKIWHDEVCNVAKDGSLYWVDTTIVPFIGKNGKPKSYVAIRTDVTDKKLAEINLIAAKKLAEDSVKSKSEFLASMSHEIRTPMNGVIGMLELLTNTKLDEGQKHQVHLAQSSAIALLSLINDILDFSKIEAGKLELETFDFDIRKEFGYFAEAIALKAQEKGVELVLDVVRVDMSIINADFNRIRQILNNIVGNSIKFTSKGYILIKVFLYAKDENSARLKVSIKDTGIGIPEDKIETLFDSFSQVDASTTRKYGGTGLGLAIVKKLCLLMNGNVKVSSVFGEGSLFEIDIEIGLSKKASLVIPPVIIKGKKAIIIDDSEISSQMLSLQLEHWGMKVIVKKDSKEALDIIDKNFDIAFIDKDLNALELADRFKQDAKLKNIKLVVMTTVRDRGDMELYIKHGYDAYFPKPATTSDIFNSLNTLAENALSLKDRESDRLEDKADVEYVWPQHTKILLVDDNKVNQLVANGLLEELGLEADVANDGAEALEMIEKMIEKESSYTIVLMDCQMPIMDGYEATRKIKSGELGEGSETIPIIAMTANAMEGDKEKCFASGMDDYISKPINSDILEDKLKKYLLKDV